MPKFAKRFLIVVAVLAGISALILLCINLYLQSGGVQQRIHDAVARSLGVEVEIQSISFTPWRGLILKDIRVPDSENAGANFVDAKELHVHFAFFPLFQQRFIVRNCTLSEPRLVVRQVEGGNWLVPLPPKISPETPKKPAAPSGSKVAGPVFHAELQHFRLNNGSVVFIDTKKRVVLQLEKVRIDADIASDLTATGTIDISQAIIAGQLKPRKISGPFSWNGEALDLPQLTGSLAGGKITGNYHVVVVHAKPSFALAVNLQEVSLKRLISEAGFDAGKAEGQLQGSLQLTGDPRTSDSTTGAGHFELIKAQLKPVEFLSKLGEIFAIEELQLLRLKEAKVDLTVHDEKVWVDNLLLKSENLVLHGSGPIRFSGKMNLTAELLINRKLQAQLKDLLELSGMDKNFVESNDPEYRQMPFHVTGRIQNPKTDLDKMVGNSVGQAVSGVLKNFFRAAPAPSATPAEPEPDDGN